MGAGPFGDRAAARGRRARGGRIRYRTAKVCAARAGLFGADESAIGRAGGTEPGEMGADLQATGCLIQMAAPNSA
ncbi:hypothetical protein NLM24_05030 [Nocardia zapadnayensis]|nr:hypothetical protein [Nocardia zapadnayensis]MCX0270083.1 hypothetical protein [Nocardia zapadnayensis]